MFQKRLWKNLEKISLGLVILIAVLSIRTLFYEGTPITWDHPIHIMATWNMADNLLPQGKPLGYDPYNFCGWVFAQYPVAYMLVSLVYYLGVGFFSIIEAYKIVIALAYILPIVSLYICMKSLGFGARIAISAAFFQTITFLDENWSAGTYFQVVYSGFFQQSFSIAFILLAIAMFHQACLREEDEWILYALAGGVFASGCLLMHPPMILLLFLCLGAYSFLSFVFRRENLSARRLIYVLAATISGLINLSAFFLLPYFSYLSSYFPYVNIASMWRWNMPTIILTITHNMTYFPVLFLGLIGFVICGYGVSFSKRFLNLITLLTVFLALGIDFLYSALSGLPIPGFEDLLFGFLYRTPILYSRYLVFLHVLVSGLASVGFVYVLEMVSKIDRQLSTLFCKVRFSSRIGILGRLPSTIFVLGFIFLCLSSQIQSTDLGYGILVQEKRILLSSDYPIYSRFASAMSWIKDNVPVETRILIEDTFGETFGNETGIPRQDVTVLRGGPQEYDSFPIASHAFALTPMYSGVSILGGWCRTDYVANNLGVTENGLIFGKYTTQIKNATQFNSFFIPAIKDLAVSFVLSHSKNFTRILQENRILFEERYFDGVFHIFQLKTISKIFEIDAAGAEVEVVNFESNYLRLNVYNLTSTTNLQIRMIYYPNWKCYVNGEEREIKVKDTLGLPFMSVCLNKGDSQVILRFENTSVNLVGEIVSWTMVLIVISIFAYHTHQSMKRRKSRIS